MCVCTLPLQRPLCIVQQVPMTYLYSSVILATPPVRPMASIVNAIEVNKHYVRLMIVNEAGHLL